MKTTLALLISLTTACHAAESRVTWITNQYEAKYDVATNFAGYNSAVSSNCIIAKLDAVIFVNTSTNFVEGNNQRGCSTCEMLRKAVESGGGIPAIYHPWHNAEPWREADEKWIIRNVVESTTITFDWMGKSYVQTSDKILSSTTNRWKLAQEWRKE